MFLFTASSANLHEGFFFNFIAGIMVLFQILINEMKPVG